MTSSIERDAAVLRTRLREQSHHRVMEGDLIQPSDLTKLLDALEAKDAEITIIRDQLKNEREAHGVAYQMRDEAEAEIAALRAALEECGAKYVPPPCAAVADGPTYIVIEFKRRMEIAAAALEQRVTRETKP